MKSALQLLNDLSFKEKLLKHPTIDVKYLPVPRFSDKNSNELTKSIIKFIRLSGGQAERIGCTGRLISKQYTFVDVIGRYRTIGQNKWIKTSGTRGTADISATYNGLSLKIEVKVKHDRQSPAQVAYQSQVEAAGGLYYVAKDFESFYQWFNITFK